MTSHSTIHFTVPFRPDIIRLPGYEQIATVPESHLRDLAKAYIQAVAPLKRDKKHLTDKMPHNFIHVGMIYLLFPNATVIHCRRDPMDNGLSLYMQNFKVLHPYIYSLEEIGRYLVGYHALMYHWRSLLPGFIHEVRYERLVVLEPKREMQKLLEFCGLEWEEACGKFYKLDRFIRTASDGQADQPLYTSSIGRWKRYKERLQPLCDIIGKTGLGER